MDRLGNISFGRYYGCLNKRNDNDNSVQDGVKHIVEPSKL